MKTGTVIDSDVHHTWRTQAEIIEYLPANWRDFLAAAGEVQTFLRAALVNLAAPGGDNKRMDTTAPDGSPPGSSYEFMCQQLLDPLGISHVVLGFDVGFESGAVNPYLAQELCRALNDWSVDHWLSIPDERICSALIVGTELPDLAAAEIRRRAGHPRIKEVLLVANAMGKPFGHPCYHPIYEAALEVGLPVAVHLGGHLVAKGLGSAGGVPATRLEEFVTNDQPGMHHATSLLTHGVFERYPDLRILLKEHGFSWLPWVLWNLDAHYPLLRQESPHVTRLPSEVFREHVVVSTQPFDYTPRGRQMGELLECYDGIEDILVFASDYPHWDTDEPHQVATRLPKKWHQKLFHDNAARFYGIEDDPEPAAAAS